MLKDAQVPSCLGQFAGRGARGGAQQVGRACNLGGEISRSRRAGVCRDQRRTAAVSSLGQAGALALPPVESCGDVNDWVAGRGAVPD